MSKQQKGTFSEKLGGRQIISYFAADDWQKTKWGNYKEYKYTKQKIFENTKLGIMQLFYFAAKKIANNTNMKIYRNTKLKMIILLLLTIDNWQNEEITSLDTLQ